MFIEALINAEGEPRQSPLQVKAATYSRSPLVREWLVYLALFGNTAKPSAHLQKMLSKTYKQVCQDLKNGDIEFEYRPSDLHTVDIPVIEHAHYMQALLYWSFKLDCTVPVLVEAYARLGKAPSVEAAMQVCKRVAKENMVTRDWKRTAGHSIGGAATMPMFQPTDASVLH